MGILTDIRYRKHTEGFVLPTQETLGNFRKKSLSSETNTPSTAEEILCPYRTRRFFSVFTRVSHWTLPWAKRIQ
jgi:hypothetical protein